MRTQCTRNKANRTITREANEGLMEEMAVRVKQNRPIMKLRKALVEHPFGTIKRGRGMGYFLCKGLESVRTEMSLMVLAYNLKRVLNIMSFADLMIAVQTSASVGRVAPRAPKPLRSKTAMECPDVPRTCDPSPS